MCVKICKNIKSSDKSKQIKAENIYYKSAHYNNKTYFQNRCIIQMFFLPWCMFLHFTVSIYHNIVKQVYFVLFVMPAVLCTLVCTLYIIALVINASHVVVSALRKYFKALMMNMFGERE